MAVCGLENAEQTRKWAGSEPVKTCGKFTDELKIDYYLEKKLGAETS
jgi:hypothetical protein